MIGILRLGAIALLAVGLSFGYLGVVDSGAPADVKRLVEQINAERQAKYAEIAKQQGAPAQAVAQIAGEKLIERAGSGEYVMGADGQWRRK